MQHLERGGLGDVTVRDAVCMRLSAAIEAVSRLDAGHRRRLFGSTWAEMWSTRNRIAHAYGLVDMEIIAATIEQDVPQVVAILQGSLADACQGNPAGSHRQE